MINKALKRKRRGAKTRAIIRASGKPRVCAYRSLKHFYVQLIKAGEKGDKVLASVSTLSVESKKAKLIANNIESATQLGAIFAEKVLALNIQQVALDCSGNKYHGQFKAFANSVRAAGLKI